MGTRRRNKKTNVQRERRLVVRGVRRDPPDLRKLGKALLSLAQAEAERQAQEQQAALEEGRQLSKGTHAPDAEEDAADGRQRS
jgi:hypothetical protein